MFGKWVPKGWPFSLKITAVLVGNMIMLQFGMSIAMPTIINGQLMSKEGQSRGEFTLTNSEASWYGM